MEDNKSQEQENIETSKENQKKNWGGYRPGAGRPLHSRNKETKEREEALRAFKARVVRKANRLFNAQMSIAEGVSMLFKVEKDNKGNNKMPELVNDEETITRFINECGGYNGTMDNDTYYFITTKVPDNKAIDSMLNRTFGKAQDHIDLTSGDRPLESPLIVSGVQPRNAEPQTEATTSN